jgi:hypothetical protein
VGAAPAVAAPTAVGPRCAVGARGTCARARVCWCLKGSGLSNPLAHPHFIDWLLPELDWLLPYQSPHAALPACNDLSARLLLPTQTPLPTAATTAGAPAPMAALADLARAPLAAMEAPASRPPTRRPRCVCGPKRLGDGAYKPSQPASICPTWPHSTLSAAPRARATRVPRVFPTHHLQHPPPLAGAPRQSTPMITETPPPTLPVSHSPSTPAGSARDLPPLARAPPAAPPSRLPPPTASLAAALAAALPLPAPLPQAWAAALVPLAASAAAPALPAPTPTPSTAAWGGKLPLSSPAAPLLCAACAHQPS